MPRRWSKLRRVTTIVNQIQPSSSSCAKESVLPFIINNCDHLNNNTASSSNNKSSVSGKETNGNGSFPLIIFIITVTLVFLFGTKKVAFGSTLLAFLLWFIEILLKSFRPNRVTATTRHLDEQTNLIQVEEMVVVSNFVGFREEFNDMIKDKENREIAENRGEGDGDSISKREEQVDGEDKMKVIQSYEHNNGERTQGLHLREVEGNVVDEYPEEVDKDRIQYANAGIPEGMSSTELRGKKSKKYVVKKILSEKFVVKKFGSKNRRSNKNESSLDPSIVQFECSSEIENIIIQEKNEEDNDPMGVSGLNGNTVQIAKHGKLERASSAEIRRDQIKKYFKKLRSKHKSGKEGKFDPDNVAFDCCSGKERMIRGRTGVKLDKDEEESIREAKRKFGDGYDLTKDGGLGRTTSAELKMKQFKQFVIKKFGRDSKRRGDKEGSLNPRTLRFNSSQEMERVTGEYLVEEQVKNQEDNDHNNEVEAKFGDGYRSIIMSEVNEVLGDGYDLIDVTNNNGDLQSMNSAEPGQNKLQKYVIKKVDSEKFTVNKFGGEELIIEKFEGECKDGRGNKDDDQLAPNNEQFCCSPEIQGLITIRGEEEEDLESPEDSQSDDEEPEGEIVYQYDSICVSETSSDMIIQGNSERSTNLGQHSFIPILIILAGLLNGRIMALVLSLLWFLLIKLHNQLQATQTTEVNSYPRKNSIKKSCS